MPILKIAEEIRQVRVANRLARIIGHEVLFRHIGDVVGLIVFGQQVVERLFLARARLFRNGIVTFLSISKLRNYIKNDPSEGVLSVLYHLAQMVFCAGFEHNLLLLLAQQRR